MQQQGAMVQLNWTRLETRPAESCHYF